MKIMDTFQLSNGVKIPCMGLGTWQTPDGAIAQRAVEEALAAGYRHIDTAAIYGNEESIGQAIRESRVKREDLFITTKLWNEQHGYEATLTACEISLHKLGLDYLDLYLIHWPNPKKFRSTFMDTNAETWRAMEKLYRDGKVRAIGVSNYRVHHLEALSKSAEIVPMVNQIRIYPGFTQPDVVKYCRQRNILVQAYSPLGTGALLEVPELVEIAKKHERSVAQICIRWCLQKGYLPLPKSITPNRIWENAEVFNFMLTGQDMNTLKFLKNYCGDGVNPDQAPF